MDCRAELDKLLVREDWELSKVQDGYLALSSSFHHLARTLEAMVSSHCTEKHHTELGDGFLLPRLLRILVLYQSLRVNTNHQEIDRGRLSTQQKVYSRNLGSQVMEVSCACRNYNVHRSYASN